MFSILITHFVKEYIQWRYPDAGTYCLRGNQSMNLIATLIILAHTYISILKRYILILISGPVTRRADRNSGFRSVDYLDKR